MWNTTGFGTWCSKLSGVSYLILFEKDTETEIIAEALRVVVILENAPSWMRNMGNFMFIFLGGTLKDYLVRENMYLNEK